MASPTSTAAVIHGTQPKDPSIPPADGTCLFFNLPGELRIQIYQYALTADAAEGLLVREKNGVRRTYTSFTTDTEFNQLKYTCRQVRAESRGLALDNNLYFERLTEESASPARQLFKFQAMCARRHLQAARTITLKPDVFDDYIDDFLHLPYYLHAIVDHCFVHPKQTVIIYPQGQHGSLEEMFVDGLIFQRALRGKAAWGQGPSQPLYEELAEQCRWGRTVEEMNAPNLLLRFQGELNESALRTLFSQSSGAHNEIIADGGIEKWVETVKSWYKHGI